jgi:hypothetical protein
MLRSFDLFNLVRDHGEPLVLKKITTSGSYDTSTGSISGASTTDYNILGYLYNYSNGLMSSDGDLKFGSRKCLISALGLTEDPDTGDLITGSNGDSVKITSISTIFSGGSKICFICDVKE